MKCFNDFGIRVDCIKEKHIDENCYIIRCGNDAIVIDPSYSEKIVSELEDINPFRILILLTHEHYDHISGVNTIRNRWGRERCKVLCSKECAKMIQSPIDNRARYYDRLFIFRDRKEREEIHRIIDREYMCAADYFFDKQVSFMFNDLSISMEKIELHSEGSVLVTINDVLVFCGDAWLDIDLGCVDSIVEHVVQAHYKNMFFFPGHGKWFQIFEGELGYIYLGEEDESDY